MRDYIVIGIILASLPFCFTRPFFGVMMWSWVSYMNPHRLAWGMAQSFPVAQYIGLATLLGWIFTKDRQGLPFERETGLIVLLWITFTITTFFALYSDLAWQRWSQVSKILVMTAATAILTIDRKKLKYLLMTIALSVAFFGVKGAIFTVLTGGSYRIYGPPHTFLSDNNDLALALVMVLPILLYLAREETHPKLRWALHGIFFMTIIGVIFTYSRGGLLGLASIVFLLFLRLKKKFLAISLLAVGLFMAYNLIPDQWFARMSTIKDYQTDASAQGRFNAWAFAWNLAADRPLTGGGFDVFQEESFKQYAPNPGDYHEAHSIYFKMLAEHGFIGLVIFVALLASAMLSLRQITKFSEGVPSASWMVGYSRMLQLSLVAYMISGAFLSRAYFDLFYQLVSIVIVLKVLARKEYDAVVHEQRELKDDHAFMDK